MARQYAIGSRHDVRYVIDAEDRDFGLQAAYAAQATFGLFTLVMVDGQTLFASVGSFPLLSSGRQYAIGSRSGVNYLIDPQDRDIALRAGYVTAGRSGAATGSIDVGLTGQEITMSMGVVTVDAGDGYPIPAATYYVHVAAGPADHATLTTGSDFDTDAPDGYDSWFALLDAEAVASTNLLQTFVGQATVTFVFNTANDCRVDLTGFGMAAFLGDASATGTDDAVGELATNLLTMSVGELSVVGHANVTVSMDPIVMQYGYPHAETNVGSIVHTSRKTQLKIPPRFMGN